MPGHAPQRDCRDRTRKDTGRLELRDIRVRNPLLFVVGIVDDGTVLRTNIGTSPVHFRGIMRDGKIDLQQLSVANFCGIEFDANHFRVPRTAGANLLVGWILRRAAGVAGYYGIHPAELIEDGFRAPKTATAEHCDFSFILTHFTPNS